MDEPENSRISGASVRERARDLQVGVVIQAKSSSVDDRFGNLKNRIYHLIWRFNRTTGRIINCGSEQLLLGICTSVRGLWLSKSNRNNRTNALSCSTLWCWEMPFEEAIERCIWTIDEVGSRAGKKIKVCVSSMKVTNIPGVPRLKCGRGYRRPTITPR